MFQDLLNLLKRKIIVTGHYGSGKTEFSVSLAMLLAQDKASAVALVDLDIINPYFRSREQRKMLTNAGISIYGSAYDCEVTAEIPEIGAALRAPLEDKNTRTIIDIGGNDSGALVLKQFIKYFTDNDTIVTAVINANRPDTATTDGAVEHINAIESASGLTVSHIINNTHLLRETTKRDIIKGYELCLDICKNTEKKLLCNCYPNEIVDPGEISDTIENLMPIGLYMRPKWLDK